MSKIEMSLEKALQFVLAGIQNGNYYAAAEIVCGLLKQIETDPRFAQSREVSSKSKSQEEVSRGDSG